MSISEPGRTRRELALAAKFCGVSLVGFGVDATLLHLGLAMRIEPAWARVISLVGAMHATFVINGLYVFRCVAPTRWPRQWAAYMAAGAFGNLCNYWIFVTLVSTHWRTVATPIFAMTAGSVSAALINYAAQRLVVWKVLQYGHSRSAYSTTLTGA
jgi:putative flippase GtrA